MMKKLFLFLSLGILLFFLVSCVPAEKECSVDKDCVPATCCHASEAVNKENALKCGGMLCSAECEPGTIDCGQGEVKCVSGKCEVVLKE